MSTKIRYFTSYTGLSLPLNLIEPIDEAAMDHRNSFFRATYDDQDRLIACEKQIYGDILMVHRYSYHPGGALCQAEIEVEGELRVLTFDEAGQRV